MKYFTTLVSILFMVACQSKQNDMLNDAIEFDKQVSALDNGQPDLSVANKLLEKAQTLNEKYPRSKPIGKDSTKKVLDLPKKLGTLFGADSAICDSYEEPNMIQYGSYYRVLYNYNSLTKSQIDSLEHIKVLAYSDFRNGEKNTRLADEKLRNSKTISIEITDLGNSAQWERTMKWYKSKKKKSSEELQKDYDNGINLIIDTVLTIREQEFMLIKNEKFEYTTPATTTKEPAKRILYTVYTISSNLGNRFNFLMHINYDISLDEVKKYLDEIVNYELIDEIQKQDQL